MELGIWIPIVIGIPDFSTCFPDSNGEIPRPKQQFPAFRNPNSLTRGHEPLSTVLLKVITMAEAAEARSNCCFL